MIRISRREAFLPTLGALLFANRLILAGEEPQPKPIRIFTFNKEKLTVGIICDEQIRLHLPRIVEYLKRDCVELKRYDLKSVSDYLTWQAIEFNKEIQKLQRGTIKVNDIRDPECLSTIPILQVSPDDVNRFGGWLVEFGFPLKLISDEVIDYDVNSVDLITYDDFKYVVRKDGIVVRYTAPPIGTTDPKGPKVPTQTVIPSDVSVFIIKEGKVYFINVQKAVQPDQKQFIKFA